MTPKELVAAFAREKDAMVDGYVHGPTTQVGEKLAALELTREAPLVRELLDALLTDAFYTVLLALDGEASLGGLQELYTLQDEAGTVLTGDLASLAWKQFHGAEER